MQENVPEKNIPPGGRIFNGWIINRFKVYRDRVSTFAATKDHTATASFEIEHPCANILQYTSLHF